MTEIKSGLVKDLFYELLSEPSREKFRDFMKNHTGEQDNVDFKKTWIEKPDLAKLLLAMANSGGGIIVIGVEESKEKIEPVGVDKLRPKADVHNEVYPLLPESLKYTQHDICYEGSDYEKLAGKQFQLIIIEDVPQKLPFLAKRDAEKFHMGDIYVRRGTKCEKANSVEVEKILNRRIETQYSSSAILNLDEHMEQLKVLYSYVNERIQTKPNDTNMFGMITALDIFRNTVAGFGMSKYEDNPYYPKETYDEFVADIIDLKKKRIKKFLDI